VDGSTTSQPLFFYDLASPEAYLAAETVHHELGVVPEWIPVNLGGPAFRCAEEEDIFKAEFERRARELQLQPVRWPDPFPFDSEWAMLVATYAKQIGRAVAFSQAAFRQAYAGGRDLGVRENVLIAAAACEMHPAAVVKGAELRGTRERLSEATAWARSLGVVETPAVVRGMPPEAAPGDGGRRPEAD
jgi:2-hydroxychromene-2-carboxylate isomerase